MADQMPAVGAIVHFVSGESHLAAIVTAIDYQVATAPSPTPEQPIVQPSQQALIVLPPMQQPFATLAIYDAAGVNATWHWPEVVQTLPDPPPEP